MRSPIKKQALLFACFWIDYKFLFDRGAGGIIYMIPTFLKVKIKMDSPNAVNPTHSKNWMQAFDFLTRRLITILIYCGAGGIRTLVQLR